MTQPETAIETLRRLARQTHQAVATQEWGDFESCGHPNCTDARNALDEVAAMVAAIRSQPCRGTMAAECPQVQPLRIEYWCWRCAALAPFKEGS